MLREFLGREVFGRIAASTGVADPQLRGALAATQMIGLIVARYVIRLPAVADATRERARRTDRPGAPAPSRGQAPRGVDFIA